MLTNVQIVRNAAANSPEIPDSLIAPAPPQDWSRVVTPKGREVTLWNEECDPTTAVCEAHLGERTAWIGEDGRVATASYRSSTYVPNRWPLPPGTLEKLDAYFDAIEAKAKPAPLTFENAGELTMRVYHRGVLSRADLYTNKVKIHNDYYDSYVITYAAFAKDCTLPDGKAIEAAE